MERGKASQRARLERAKGLLVGLVAATVFASAASVRLDAQGLYYDELHQATAAFSYTGRGPQAFTSLAYRGVPLLNMRYSGAIKSALYGSYLRWTGAAFGVVSWRLVGILVVAASLVAFCAAASSAIRGSPLGVFLALFVTDGTVLLATRHDWGPVALALALRLLFVGVWLRSELRAERNTSIPAPSAASSFLLGSIVSVACFEKLSSVVLLPVFLGFMAASPGRRTLRHWLWAAAGLAIGGAPLIAVNWISQLGSGIWISLAEPANPHSLDFLEWLRMMGMYFQLGSGTAVRGFILGNEAWRWLVALEAGLSAALVGAAGWLAVRGWRGCLAARVAGLAVMAYLVIPNLLYLLPQRVWVHHLILGTPFQYAAITATAVAIHRVSGSDAVRFGNVFQFAFRFVLGSLLVVRLVSALSLELALVRGEASPAWDPSFTAAGRFLADQKHALVFAGSWGVATQIDCFANGRSGAIRRFSKEIRSAATIRYTVQRSPEPVFYVVRRNTDEPEARTVELWADLSQLSRWLPGWKEVPVQIALGDRPMVEIRQFVRGN